MENKIASKNETALIRDPELAEAIIEVLTKEMDAVAVLLEKKDFFEKN